MQDTDVRMEAEMQETCQKCILCQGYATSALTQGEIRAPLPKMKTRTRGEIRGWHKMEEDYNLRK